MSAAQGRMKFTGSALLLAAFGSAAGFSLSSILSTSLLETNYSLKKSVEKIVPNKILHPRRIQIERKKDPNDFYLDEKNKQEKMAEILANMMNPGKISETQKQVQYYNLRKNAVFGLIGGSMGSILLRTMFSSLRKSAIPVSFTVLLSAPASIFAYYAFVGTFDNMEYKAVIEKLKKEGPLLLAIKASIDLYKSFVASRMRDSLEINISILKKAKENKVDPKSIKLLKTSPWLRFVSMGLMTFWVLFMVSVYEERIEVYGFNVSYNPSESGQDDLSGK